MEVKIESRDPDYDPDFDLDPDTPEWMVVLFVVIGIICAFNT